MRGMNATTGKPIEGADHLRQSVADILLTPIGTRVGRRDYGSLLFELIDQPLNAVAKIRIYAAVALALNRWEPRLRLTQVTLSVAAAGGAALEVVGQRTDVPPPNSLTRLTVPLGTATFSA